MSDIQDVAPVATELDAPIGHTMYDDAITDGTPNIVDEKDPRITYHGEAAKAVKFTPDETAVAIRVFSDGTVLTEF